MPPRTATQRAGDLAKGLAALVTLVTLVAGLPMGLYRFGGQWLPKTVPTLAQARDALGHPVSDGAILTGLTLICWALWALFAFAVIVEVVSWAGSLASPSTRRRGPARGCRVRLAVPGMQNAAASLVMAALLILPTAGAASASTSAAPPAPTALEIPPVAPRPSSPGPTPSAPPSAAAPSAAQPAAERYTVKRGDSPWGIAQNRLGSGERWRELRHADDGRPLASRELIHAGQVLHVPARTPAVGPAAPVAVPASAETVVVQPGDSLWEIAEDHLGDGAKYPGIWQANRGHVMADGHRFSAPDLIRPGWSLEVPAAATAPPLPAAAAPAAALPVPAPSETVDPTETPDPQEQAPAEATAVQAAPPATSLPAAPATTAVPAVPAAPPSTFLPVAPPATAVPAVPAVPAASPATTVPATTVAPTPPATRPPVATPAGSPPQTLAPVTPAPAAPKAERTGSSAPGRERLPVAPLGVAGAVVAAGVGAEVLRRRRRQLARRRPDDRLPALTDPAARAARAVAYAPVEDVEWLGAELRLLVRALGSPARARFEATVVQYRGQERIEVALARSCGKPPEGWSGPPGSKVWTLKSPHIPEELAAAADLPPCLPLLVSLGDADEHGQVLLNLEASSAIGIVGDPAMVEGLVRSLLWELATSPLAEHLTLVTAGIDAQDGKEMARWRRARDAEDVASLLRQHSSAVARSLAETGIPSLPAARAQGEDPWAPTVAVVAAELATAEVLEAASGPGAVVVVVGGCPPDALEIQAAAGEVAIPSIGLVCVAQQLTRATADDLGSLLTETTADPVSADPIEELRLLEDAVAAHPCPPAADDAAPAFKGPGPAGPADSEVIDLEPWVPPTPRVLVRLLGPPSVEGAVRPLTPQQLAGLAYLATHKSATKMQVMDALWGDSPPTDVRWRDFLSDLRVTIPDGISMIPQVRDGVVDTSDELGSDLDQMVAYLARARTHPDDRVRCLQAATGLLRGVPFAYDPKCRKFWRWVDVDYVDGRVFQQLAQAGYELAKTYLDAGDPEAASQVANRLLVASPLDAGLTEILIVAYEAMGSPGAADRVFEAHDSALLDLCGYEGAGEVTQLLIKRIRDARARKSDGHPLSLVRE